MKNDNSTRQITFAGFVDWFIPPEIVEGNRPLLARSRLLVIFGWTICLLAVIYALIFFAMNSLICGSTLVVAAVLIGTWVLTYRLTRSIAVSGNLLIATYVAVLTVLACYLGGHGSPALPWHSAAPAIALCTLGRRSALAWLVPVLMVSCTLYGLELFDVSVPIDIAPSHYQFLWLVSVVGLSLLLLCIALHYEATKAELDRARVEAEAASRAKSEFLANMSHEIRTPMTAVLGFSDVLLSSTKDREQQESIAIIKRNGEYLINVINDILDLSKIEAGKLEVEAIPVSITQLIDDVVSLMQVRADSKGLTLSTKFDGPIPAEIQTDPTRLRQILVNLVGNAIKFTEVGGVQLETRIHGAKSAHPRIEIAVTDSGIGMTESQMAKLFQPFSQADYSTTRNFGGTGLGLAISQRLAKKLGGDIGVNSKAGEGSTFTLSISTGNLQQASWIDGTQPTKIKSERVSESSTTTESLSGRILLAEDGADNQRLISFVLKKAGAEVVIAENGEIARGLALKELEQDNPFDVILMDMQMPVMDGYTAARALRDAGYTRPIIALTAHAMSDDRAKCLEAGCDDYATKPINRQELISLINTHQARLDQSTPPATTNVAEVAKLPTS